MNTHEVHDLSSREIKPDKINPSPIPGGSGNVGKQSKASKRKENARLKTKQKARSLFAYQRTVFFSYERSVPDFISPQVNRPKDARGEDGWGKKERERRAHTF